MTGPEHHAWQCASCGRHVPRNVEVCRCSAARPEPPAAVEQAASKAPADMVTRVRAWGAAQVRCVREGCAFEAALPRAWRIWSWTVFGVAVAVVLLVTAMMNFRDPAATRGNIRVLTSLDAFTRTADAAEANAIPAFLASAGALGAVEDAWPSDAPVGAVDEIELRRGFCSRSLARLVRHEYPGFYDGWPDARLERTVMENHPEYRERVCAVPAVLGAGPEHIVKYELQPRSALAVAGLTAWTLLVTGGFAATCLVAYYRGIAGYARSASG